eukprot:6206700-Pleurochrysis_carterae.AAC.1
MSFETELASFVLTARRPHSFSYISTAAWALPFLHAFALSANEEVLRHSGLPCLLPLPQPPHLDVIRGLCAFLPTFEWSRAPHIVSLSYVVRVSTKGGFAVKTPLADLSKADDVKKLHRAFNIDPCFFRQQRASP